MVDPLTFLYIKESFQSYIFHNFCSMILCDICVNFKENSVWSSRTGVPEERSASFYVFEVSSKTISLLTFLYIKQNIV